MRTLRLRQAPRHPLLGPELAFAFAVAGGAQPISNSRQQPATVIPARS